MRRIVASVLGSQLDGWRHAETSFGSESRSDQPMASAIIFDFDGVIADQARCWLKRVQLACYAELRVSANGSSPKQSRWIVAIPRLA